MRSVIRYTIERGGWGGGGGRERQREKERETGGKVRDRVLQKCENPGGTKPRTPHHRSAWRREEAKVTREGHRQSDEQWNCFKSNVGKTSERRGGAHMGFSDRIDTILN